jgi:hypothetical protein
MNKKIILSSSIENRILTEVKRINDLMGTKLITEALISPKLTKFLSDIINASPDVSKRAKWITDDVIRSATRLNNYLDNLPSNANINIPIILRDLKILSNSNVEIKNLVSDFFAGLEQYKPLFDEVNERLKLIPDLQKLKPSEVKQKLVDILTDIYTKGGTIPLDPQVADAINLIVTNKFVNTTLRGRYIDDIIIKNPNIFDALTSKGKTIVDNLNKNLETLTTAKGQGGTLNIGEVSKLEQKIKNDFSLLYLWKRKFYDDYIKLLESYKTGATNVENAKLYDEIITDVKQHYGDWTILEDLSETGNPPLQAIWKGIKGGVSMEGKFLEFLSKSLKKLSPLGKKSDEVVDATKSEIPQVWWKQTLKYLILTSPKGIPKSFTKGYTNPYKEIIQNSGMWGANASYAVEVLTRAYKLTVFLAVVNSINKMLKASDTKILTKFGEEGKKCMDNFSEIIKQKRWIGTFGVSDSTLRDYLASEEVLQQLPCIVELNLSEEELRDFSMASMYRAAPGYGSVGFLSALPVEAANDIIRRVSNDPSIGIPIPAAQIISVSRQIGEVGIQRWFNGELEQLRLPDLVNRNDSVAGGTNAGTTNNTQQGPVRGTTTSTTQSQTTRSSINTGRD